MKVIRLLKRRGFKRKKNVFFDEIQRKQRLGIKKCGTLKTGGRRKFQGLLFYLHVEKTLEEGRLNLLFYLTSCLREIIALMRICLKYTYNHLGYFIYYCT